MEVSATAACMATDLASIAFQRMGVIPGERDLNNLAGELAAAFSPDDLRAMIVDLVSTLHTTSAGANPASHR